jgi:hypothetical protein
MQSTGAFPSGAGQLPRVRQGAPARPAVRTRQRIGSDRFRSHASISGSHQPTVFDDNRRCRGNWPARSRRHTDDRLKPTRLASSRKRRNLGPVPGHIDCADMSDWDGDSAGVGRGGSDRRFQSFSKTADVSRCTSASSRVSSTMRRAISDDRPCNSVSVAIKTSRSCVVVEPSLHSLWTYLDARPPARRLFAFGSFGARMFSIHAQLPRAHVLKETRLRKPTHARLVRPRGSRCSSGSASRISFLFACLVATRSKRGVL